MKQYLPIICLALLFVTTAFGCEEGHVHAHQEVAEGECVAGSLHCPEILSKSLTRVPVPGGYLYHNVYASGIFVEDCNAPHIDDNPGTCWVD